MKPLTVRRRTVLSLAAAYSLVDFMWFNPRLILAIHNWNSTTAD